jgi:hypothetical protein
LGIQTPGDGTPDLYDGTINTPANVQQGDVMLAHVVVNAGTSASISAPAGWMQVASEDNAQIRTSVFWRAVTQSEPTTHNSSSTAREKQLAALSATPGSTSPAP